MMKILHLSDLHVEPVGKLAYARANTARRMIELTEWLAQHKDESVSTSPHAAVTEY